MTSLTIRGKALAENSHHVFKIIEHAKLLSVSDDLNEFGIDREEKEELISIMTKRFKFIADIAAQEIPAGKDIS